MNSNDLDSLNLRQRLRFLAKDFILYGGAASFNKAFALLTFPILARHFPVEQYGVYDFLNVGISLLSIIFVFGQDSAVARFYYEYTDTPTRRQIISQSFAFQMGRMFIVLLPLWWGAEYLTGLFKKSGVEIDLIRLVLLQIPFMGLINFSQNILKWTFSRLQFLTISLGSTSCSMATLLVALCCFDVGLREVFIIFLCSRAVFGLLGLWFCRPWLAWPKDWDFLWSTFLFAVPYGIICTVSALIPALERTFIVGFLSERELGLFAAGARIAMLMSLPIQAFQIAWGPFSLAIHKKNDAHITYSHVLRSFSLGMVVLAMALTVIAEPLIRILASSSYAGSSIVVFPVAMGLALQGISGIVTVGISLSKKTYLHLFSYTTYLAVSVVAIYLLIQVFGLVGVAWGAMLGRLSMSVAQSWMSNRVYPVPWGFRRIVPCLGFVFLWGGTGQIVTMHFGMIHGAVINAFGLAVLIPLGLVMLFSKPEREQISAWIRRNWHRRSAVWLASRSS